MPQMNNVVDIAQSSSQGAQQDAEKSAVSDVVDNAPSVVSVPLALPFVFAKRNGVLVSAESIENSEQVVVLMRLV